MYQQIMDGMVARLQEKLPAGVTVTTHDELATVIELRQKAPAAFVIYDGYQVGGEGHPAGPTQLQLQYTVVVATKNATDRGRTQSARREADELSLQVIAALLGQSFIGGTYVRVFAAPGPQYEGGFVYLPIGFVVAVTFRPDKT
jgi:hypothetical protein